MLEIFAILFMWAAATVAVALVIIAWVVCIYGIGVETQTVFKQIRYNRATNKFFKNIEEFRNDFV